jgi:ribonuclease P protein component
MLAKKHKTPRATIVNLLKEKQEKKVFHTESLTLVVYKKEDTKNESLFTFVVSKKTAPQAVIRNSLKRRGYSSIQRLIEKIEKGFIFIFYFKKGSRAKTYQEIFFEIKLLLQKAHVVKN